MTPSQQTFRAVLALFAFVGFVSSEASAQGPPTGPPPPSVPPTISVAYILPPDDAAGIGHENKGAVDSPKVKVVLSHASTDSISVQYATADGSAKAGEDYVAKTGTLVFAPGETSKEISIDLVNDGASEPVEFGWIELNNPVNGYLGQAKGRFIIYDDDGPPVTVEFKAASYSVNENVGMCQIEVKLSESTIHSVKVDWTSAGDGTSPAQSPADYTPANGSITIPAGSTSATLMVTIVNDSQVEPNESAKFTLTTVAYGPVLGTQKETLLEITNDDLPPQWTISVVSDRTTICAGGKAGSPHEATITAILMDAATGMPSLTPGINVTFDTTIGTLSAASALTDENGRASVMLTSSNLASEGMVQVQATVAGHLGANNASTKVEFQAPQAALTASPSTLVQGESSDLVLTLKWNEYPVDKHGLAWSVAKVWNAEGELVYDEVGDYPAGYGSFDARSDETTTGGYGAATFRGTAPGKVQLHSVDVDVVLVVGGEKPKASVDVSTTGEGGLAQIYNGSSGIDGKQDGKKVIFDDLGAFTVANLNDTDGDGIVDKDDANVKGTKKGRDEVDLMRLVLLPQKPDGMNKINVTLVKGKARFWLHSHKEKEVDIIANGFTPGGGHLWVEATDHSGEVGDIEIKVEYKGIAKTVRATAVWAKQTDVRYKNDETYPVKAWDDFPTAGLIHTFLQSAEHFGLTYRNKKMKDNFRNVIAIQYSLLPKGIETYKGLVRFDISRRVHFKDVTKQMDKKDVIHSRTFPEMNEEPNDDSHNDDESDTTDKGRMYVLDAVEGGDRVNNAGFISLISHSTFQEFIRVRFDAIRPEGNNINGSRCSDLYEWHVRQHIIVDEAHPTNPALVILKRNTGDDPQSTSNDVGPSAITIP